ncbi:MAG: glycosyltransferase [Acidimicrobiales bacterium]
MDGDHAKGQLPSQAGPEVSFVVIAYNESANIERCIRAILNQQNCGRLEVVVVDDGSTDSTAAIAEAIGQQTGQVRVLRSPKNEGRGAARARGVASATADFVAMVDADTLIPANWLQQCRQAITNCDAVGGLAVPDGDVTYLYNTFRLTPRPRPHTFAITGNNGLYRRQVFEKVPLDPALAEGEDIALVKAMQAAGLRLHSLPELLVEHRESKNFLQSLRWLFQSGKGAARQYFRYGDVRLPDLAFALVIASTLGGALVPARGHRLALSAAGAVVACTATASAHTLSRFRLRRQDALRLAAAAATDSLLVAAYMAGRVVGLAGLGNAR